jgi:hypothetical protein
LKQLPNPSPDAKAEPGRAFFVSVLDGDRHGFLAGPYSVFGEAAAKVEAAKALAAQHDDRAHWYAYGTCQAPAESRAVFGVL